VSITPLLIVKPADPTESAHGVGKPAVIVCLLIAFKFQRSQSQYNPDPISPPERREVGPVNLRPIRTESGGHYIPGPSHPVNFIRPLIDAEPIRAQYNIISIRPFVMPWTTAILRGVAPHRFILLELMLDGERMWLQLERRPDSKVALLRGLGRTSARDEVRLYSFYHHSWGENSDSVIKGQFLNHHRGILPGLRRRGYRQENLYQLDPPHPTLRDLSVIIDVICQLHPQYTLYRVCTFAKQ